MHKTWVCSLGQEDPLEESMTTHGSIPAWRIPWTGESGGLQTMGSHRFGSYSRVVITHHWTTNTILASSTRWCSQLIFSISFLVLNSASSKDLGSCYCIIALPFVNVYVIIGRGGVFKVSLILYKGKMNSFFFFLLHLLIEFLLFQLLKKDEKYKTLVHCNRIYVPLWSDKEGHGWALKAFIFGSKIQLQMTIFAGSVVY